MARTTERATGTTEAVPEPGTAWLLAIFLSTMFLSNLRRRSMKTILFCGFLAFATAAYAGEGSTGLQGPEPNTIALLGAAVLFGVPAYFYRRRKKRVEAAAENEEAGQPTL